MNLEEILATIRRNKHKRNDAIRLISDFLQLSKEEATEIYEREFGENACKPKSRGKKRA